MSERPAIEGVIPIVAVPYRADEGIDFDGLAREVDFLVQSGVDGLGVGLASEVARLTEAEQDDITNCVSEATGRRVPVLGTAVGGSTRSVIDRSTSLAHRGADRIMVAPPPVIGGDRDALRRFFWAIADAVDRPLVVLDAPSMTGVELSADTLANLALEVEAIAALKVEAPPTGPKIAAIRSLLDRGTSILGGAGGSDTMSELRCGADGSVPGPALPEVFVHVHRLHRDGDDERAQRIFERYQPLFALSVRSFDMFLYVQKEVLRRRGVLGSTRVRTPSERLDSSIVNEVSDLLDALRVNPDWTTADNLGN